MSIRIGLVAAAMGGLVVVGGVAAAAPEPPPAASLTVRPGQQPPAPAPAILASPARFAQSGIGAGPLQGPLAGAGTGSGAVCCPCRTVHHVVHRRRVVRQAAPVLVAQAPRFVPLVPLVPYRPVYVYRPLVAYRPLVPFYPRPFFYRPFFRPYGYPIY